MRIIPSVRKYLVVLSKNGHILRTTLVSLAGNRLTMYDAVIAASNMSGFGSFKPKQKELKALEEKCNCYINLNHMDEGATAALNCQQGAMLSIIGITRLSDITVLAD